MVFLRTLSTRFYLACPCLLIFSFLWVVVVNFPPSVYPSGFFFLLFPSFVPLFSWYCVRRYNVRFLLYRTFILTLEVFLGQIYWILGIFPCMSFCYTLCKWIFQSALAVFRYVLGSYCFLCILLFHYQKQRFSVSFCLLQYLWCHCFVIYYLKIFLQIKCTQPSITGILATLLP